MDIQSIIVTLILIAAVGYVAMLIFKKTRSFSAKSRCASDCGCGSGSTKKQTAI